MTIMGLSNHYYTKFQTNNKSCVPARRQVHSINEITALLSGNSIWRVSIWYLWSNQILKSECTRELSLQTMEGDKSLPYARPNQHAALSVPLHVPIICH